MGPPDEEGRSLAAPRCLVWVVGWPPRPFTPSHQGRARRAPGGPGSDGPLPALPVGVAQLALVELAVGVPRHLGDEVDALGSLEPGQAALAPGEDLRLELGPRLHPRGGLDDRLDLLAPVL